MPVTPTGSLSLSIENLRKLVAASPAFREWTGTADADAAMARAHHTALPPPADGKSYTLAELQAARPYALADVDRRGGGFTRTRVAETQYEDSGALLLAFEADVDPDQADDYQAAETEFMNRLGAVLDDMAALSGSEGFLTVHSFTVEGVERASVDSCESEGDYHVASVRVAWGV